jgi:hypothetical protein
MTARMELGRSVLLIGCILVIIAYVEVELQRNQIWWLHCLRISKFRWWGGAKDRVLTPDAPVVGQNTRGHRHITVPDIHALITPRSKAYARTSERIKASLGSEVEVDE